MLDYDEINKKMDEKMTKKEPKKKFNGKKTFFAIIIFGIVGYGLYSVYIAATTMYILGSYAKYKSHEFHEKLEKYQSINEHNDSRISFYVEEFNKSGEKYFDANTVPERFKARVERKLALNCIGYFLQEHNDTTWLDQVQAVDRNQLNAYEQNNTTYNKIKPDEDWNFYEHYYFSEIYDAQEKVASSFEEEVSQRSCDKLQSTDKMFENFLPIYVRTKEKTLSYDIVQEKQANYFGTLNKSFYQKSIKDTKKLLRIIYKGFPILFQIKKTKTLEKKKEQQREITYFFDKASGKIKMSDKYDCEEIITKKIAFDVRNEEGQTPLIVSVINKNFEMTGCLLGIYHKTKVHIPHIKQKDHHGKTAHDYYMAERDSILRNSDNLPMELVIGIDELKRY